MTCNLKKFERYTMAFIDYQIACANFNEAMFNISKNGLGESAFVDDLAHVLAIKHAHFLECARRVLGGREFKSTLIRGPIRPQKCSVS